jgi:hypothetical protein
MMLGVLHVVFQEYRYTVCGWGIQRVWMGKEAMGGERWVDRREMPGATMAVLDVVRE